MKTIVIDWLLRQLRYFVNLFAIFIGHLFYPDQKSYLPSIKSNLLLEPAIKLADRIKSGELKSEVLIRAVIDRCKEVQKDLNAIVDDNFEDALAKAREIDDRVQRELNGEQPVEGEPSIHQFPFLGVPFTTKNSLPYKGKTYSSGTWSRKGLIADKTCASNRLMLDNGGAIFLAVTNVPDMVMWFDSSNRIDGRTNNPYDKSRIPGGSSGGEAALISAAGSIIGVGSDIGGSIRIPSHYCGIFGHYTTPNVVKVDEIYPPESDKRRKMLSIGPMARFACDLRPMLKILCENKIPLEAKSMNYSKLNVYYLRSLNDPLATPVDAEIDQGMNRVLKYFIEKGTRTIELNMKRSDPESFYEFRLAFELWLTSMKDSESPTFMEMISNGEKINPFWEFFKSTISINEHYSSGALMVALIEKYSWMLGLNDDHDKLAERLRTNFHRLLGSNGVLICPTLPETALKHNQTVLKATDIIYTNLWNSMNVAITTVPVGLDRHGLPYNIQIIASPNNDNLSLLVAEELEQNFGCHWTPPCQIQTALDSH